MSEVQKTAAIVIALIMAIIVVGTIITYTATDAILGSTTSVVTPINNLGWVAFAILGIGIIALVGKFIISIFQ